MQASRTIFRLLGLLIPIRRKFDLSANVRPVRLMPGVKRPLADSQPSDIDMLIVRENTEGEYSSTGGVLDEGTDNERAVQESVFTRKGADRILRYAFEAALKRRGSVTSATKSNGIAVTMPYWDGRFAAIGSEYQDIAVSHRHPDGTVCPRSATVRRGWRLQSFRRHPFGPGSGVCRDYRDRAFGGTSIRSECFLRYSNRCMARRRISSAARLRTRLARYRQVQ